MTPDRFDLVVKGRVPSEVTLTRADTGEVVRLIEVLPVGGEVWCRIEYDTGDTSLVPKQYLRAS